MTTLLVVNIQTGSATTDMSISTGNVSGAGITLYTNNSGLAIEANSSYNFLTINSSSGVLFNGSPAGTQNITNTSIFGSGQIIASGNVTPSIITSNTTAWNPDSSDIAFNIRLSANAAGSASNTAIYEAYISGFSAGTNGQIYTIHNIGSQKIQIRKEDSVNETTAANRFNIPDHIWLYGFQSMQFIYDGTLSRWRPVNHLGASPSNSLGYDYAGIVTRRFDYRSLVKGFFAGGQNSGTPYATTDRTTFSTESTAAVTGANLSGVRDSLGGVGNADKGFFGGGWVSPAFTFAPACDKTTHSTETTAVTAFTFARINYGSAGNVDKGFFASGRNNPSSGYVTNTSRITYSSETIADIAGSALSLARNDPGGAGNSDKGFFAGGISPTSPTSYVATTDRTIYATETTAAVAGANLTTSKNNAGSAGNADKGFFAGGAPTTATTDRTTYSTETTAAVSGANLSQARYSSRGTGNVDKGFFAGGTLSGSPFYAATTDRTTYSSETTAAVTGANLSQARGNLAAI